MAEKDLTDRLERIAAFEGRAHVRFTALSAFWDGGRLVRVNGELHPSQGDSLVADVDLELGVYDDRERLMATATDTILRRDFFGFYAFSIVAYLPETIREISKLRLIPRPSPFQDEDGSDPDEEDDEEFEQDDGGFEDESEDDAPPELRGVTVADIFSEMPKRFDPRAAGGLDAVIQYQLTGSRGCSYFATIRDRQLVLREGAHPSPNLTLQMTADDFVRLSLGLLNGQQAFMQSRMKIRGDMGLATRMAELFKNES